MTILDKSQNDKKDELIVNENDTTTVISTEVQRSGEISAKPNGVEGELTAPLSSRASSRDLPHNVMSTEVETSNPQCHPESEAQRSREDLNPNVMSTEVETSNPNVISTEVQRSGEISAEPDGDEIIDEAALEEKYSELESVRESAETIDAEMADLSYLEDLKKKTEPQELSAEEKKTQKQKQAEERKRKRQEENDLFARRYKAKSINAAVAQSSPIIYFYNAILTKKGKIQLFNVYQVLQDRFLGKLVPQLWMAVAEASDRVLELNMANLIEQIKVCEKYPEYEFILQMSTRFFTKPAVLEKMTALIDHPVPNLVMSFDCVSLQNLGTAAKTGLAAIKEKGVKIVLDNTEKVSMTTLSELDFDYLRLDSRYYELGNFKSEGFLRLLTGFAKELGIPTIAMFCDDQDMVEYMLYMGVDMVQGNAVSRPMRTIPNALGAVTPVESMLIEDETVEE